MNTDELQELRRACDYAEAKQHPVVSVPVVTLRSILADYEKAKAAPPQTCPLDGPHAPRWFNPVGGSFHCMGDHQ
jgi:hypothetical protein